MAPDPIVFLCSNPIPEMWPWDAKEAGAAVVATGRSRLPQPGQQLGRLSGHLPRHARRARRRIEVIVLARVEGTEYAGRPTRSGRAIALIQSARCCRALLGEGDADVGALQRVGDAALALLGVGRLTVVPLGGPLDLDRLDVAAAFVQDALAVDHHALLAVGAEGEDEAADGHVGGAAADEGDLHVFHLAADDLERVDEAGQGDAGRALLVVVPARGSALGAQCVEDAEALGLGDVLEVDAAQARLHELDELDELVGVFGVDHQREAVHAAEVLVEERLAFHDRHAGLGAISPMPSTRVPSLMTATVLPLLVYS